MLWHLPRSACREIKKAMSVMWLISTCQRWCLLHTLLMCLSPSGLHEPFGTIYISQRNNFTTWNGLKHCTSFLSLGLIEIFPESCSQHHLSIQCIATASLKVLSHLKLSMFLTFRLEETWEDAHCFQGLSVVVVKSSSNPPQKMRQCNTGSGVNSGVYTDRGCLWMWITSVSEWVPSTSHLW